MLVPTIHLNGTSKKVLLEQVSTAHNCLRDAMERLVLAAPNGRDYYPQGDGAIIQAMREHEGRMSRLAEVLDELEEMCLGVEDQQ